MSTSNQTGGRSSGVVHDELKAQPATRSIVANLTLTSLSAPLQWIAADTARDVTLPDVATNAGKVFYLVNASNGASTLTVKNAGGSTIVSMNQNAIAVVISNGVEWRGHSYVAPTGSVQTSDIADGAVTTSKITNSTILDADVDAEQFNQRVIKSLADNNTTGAIPVVFHARIATGALTKELSLDFATVLLDALIQSESLMPACTVLNILIGTTTWARIGSLGDSAGPLGTVKRAAEIATARNVAANGLVKLVIQGATNAGGMGITIFGARGSFV